jgi:uncharacterized damage-inducible protein DinB
MNTIKTNVVLLGAILFFNVSLAQKISLPEKMASVDIAALYVPGTIIKAAEQMPEEYYTFRPTKEIRSFGELIAHIAESNFEMCAIAKGEASPMPKVATTKAEAVDALKKAFNYSTKARETMTKQQKETMVKFMGQSQPAGNVLDFSILHSMQHYGNVIVYMRLKGLVPPSSQSGNSGSAHKKED